MDFGKFEVKHFDELDSTTWKLMDTGSTITLASEELVPLSY